MDAQPISIAAAPVAAAPMPAAINLPPGVTHLGAGGLPPAAPAAPAAPLANGGPAPTGNSTADLLKNTNWLMITVISVAVAGIFMGIYYYRNRIYVFDDKQKETDFQISSLQSQISELKKKEEGQA